MILQRLTARDFRNLDAAEISFHPAVNLFLGHNGQGKTNLLEAIYFLATTKSFRTPRIASLVRFDASGLFVAGALKRGELEQTMSIGVDHGDSRQRMLLLNAQKVTLSAYLKGLTVFAYSSARLEIIRGSPEEKRRFLDRGIASIEPGYLDLLTRYGRIVKQRNALLAAISTRSASAAALEAWDEELMSVAHAVTLARAAYTERLSSVFLRIVAEYRYHVDSLVVSYRPGGLDYRQGDPTVWRSALQSLRREEIRSRLTLTGPHRDTLLFEIEGRPAAEVLSGGELKTMILFLKFAKLSIYREVLDEPAVFLLDDVDAELDLPILEGLLSNLPEAVQVFASSAKASYLRTLQASPHRRFLMEDGRVVSVENT